MGWSDRREAQRQLSRQAAVSCLKAGSAGREKLGGVSRQGTHLLGLVSVFFGLKCFVDAHFLSPGGGLPTNPTGI